MRPPSLRARLLFASSALTMDSTVGICIENKKLSTIAEVTEFGTFLSTECSNDTSENHHQTADGDQTLSRPSDSTTAMEQQLLNDLHEIKLDLIKMYEVEFEKFFLELIEKHNLDKEVFAQVKKRHMNMVDETLSGTIDKILDKQEIQKKWKNILDLDSSLTLNPTFLAQISPSRQQHCSQIKDIKVKVTESRNLAYNQLEANLASVKNHVVKNKEVELLKQFNKLISSLPRTIEIGLNKNSN